MVSGASATDPYLKAFGESPEKEKTNSRSGSEGEDDSEDGEPGESDSVFLVELGRGTSGRRRTNCSSNNADRDEDHPPSEDSSGYEPTGNQ